MRVTRAHSVSRSCLSRRSRSSRCEVLSVGEDMARSWLGDRGLTTNHQVMTPHIPSERSVANVSIRTATRFDAGRVANIAAQTFVETYIDLCDPVDVVTYVGECLTKARMRVELCEPGSTFFLAEADGILVGYAKLRRRTLELPDELFGESVSACELQRLYVSSDLMGAGVGSKLIRSCLRAVISTEQQSLWLMVDSGNERAISFYERFGFRIVGSAGFRMGATTYPDWIMYRSLGYGAMPVALSQRDVPVLASR